MTPTLEPVSRSPTALLCETTPSGSSGRLLLTIPTPEPGREGVIVADSSHVGMSITFYGLFTREKTGFHVSA